MFATYSYLRQHNGNQPILDYKEYYKIFSNSREFGGEFTNVDHLVKNRFMDAFGYVYNAVLRKNPRNVLDIGCGNGVNLPISRILPEIDFHGLDYAEKALISAKAAYPNVTFHVEDAFNMSFPPETFDLAILSGVLILYREEKDRLNLLAEIHRILAENGVLVLIVWNESPLLKASIQLSRVLGRCFNQQLPEDFMGLHFKPREILHMARKSGFQVEEQIHTAHYYGILESVRYLNFNRYNRIFGKAESEAGREHSQNILRDLQQQAGKWSSLTWVLYALSRINHRWFSMFSVYHLRKA
ncbi:hypothetical protein D3C87_851160 [compost metagenome]